MLDLIRRFKKRTDLLEPEELEGTMEEILHFLNIRFKWMGEAFTEIENHIIKLEERILELDPSSCPECKGNKHIGGDKDSPWSCYTCVMGPVRRKMVKDGKFKT